MISKLAIFLLLVLSSCQTRLYDTEAVITPRECKRACYPLGVLEVEALEGVCKCQPKPNN